MLHLQINISTNLGEEHAAEILQSLSIALRTNSADCFGEIKDLQGHRIALVQAQKTAFTTQGEAP